MDDGYVVFVGEFLEIFGWVVDVDLDCVVWIEYVVENGKLEWVVMLEFGVFIGIGCVVMCIDMDEVNWFFCIDSFED